MSERGAAASGQPSLMPGERTDVSVDYDGIASSYDRRYQAHDYSGIEATLRQLSIGARDVLEVGCGTGHWIDRLREDGRHVVGLDPSAEMVRRAVNKGSGLRFALGTAEALPFRSRSFDLIIVVNALHHFADPRRFLSEAKRVVREGGRVATVGLDPSRGISSWYVYDYFANTLDVDRQCYPACETIRGWMTAAGFMDPVTRLAQRIRERRDAQACLDQGIVAKHSTSQLARLSDEEYRAGVERIRADIECAESRDETLDLQADLHLFVTIGRS